MASMSRRRLALLVLTGAVVTFLSSSLFHGQESLAPSLSPRARLRSGISKAEARVRCNADDFGIPPAAPQRRVVVTGLGAVTPLANNVKETWQKILDGKVCIPPGVNPLLPVPDVLTHQLFLPVCFPVTTQYARRLSISVTFAKTHEFYVHRQWEFCRFRRGAELRETGVKMLTDPKFEVLPTKIAAYVSDFSSDGVGFRSPQIQGQA
eukprot:1330565-Amorphochlora_amoeboformis.AAC.1